MKIKIKLPKEVVDHLHSIGEIYTEFNGEEKWMKDDNWYFMAGNDETYIVTGLDIPDSLKQDRKDMLLYLMRVKSEAIDSLGMQLQDAKDQLNRIPNWVKRIYGAQ